MKESDLLTAEEAASLLRIGRRTFDAHVARGDIHYIAIGLGQKRTRKRFDPADIDRFRENQRRAACPSSNAQDRRRTPTTSGSGAVDFRAILEQRRAEKRNARKSALAH